MRARQVFATLFGGGIGQALPLGLLMVALNIVMAARKSQVTPAMPIIVVASFATFIVLGAITTAIVLLAPFWWLAKRRKLNVLSALLTGAIAGAVVTAVAVAVWAIWWRVGNGWWLAYGIGIDTEILAVCGAIGAWAGWRLTEPKRVLPASTAEMF